MSKFKKDGKKGLPAISTASLPDIIFMLLFFFMVSTVMREVELKVSVKAPKASEVQKLEDKSLVSAIYIGKPTKVLAKKWGDEDRIQLNDAFAEVNEIRGYVEEKVTKIPEYKRKKHIVSMKVDSDARMGIVTDVKQELRKANALKINYSTLRGFDANKGE